MSDAYIGEIRMFTGNYAPEGWAFCHGQTLSVSEYEALFSLIGNRFGGDGVSSFALPDLRGRVPIHMGTSPATGTSYLLGANGGAESVTLTANQLPSHTHMAQVQTSGETSPEPTGHVWAKGINQFSTSTPNGTMNPDNLIATGGGQAHDNMMPFLTVNFIISLYGMYPSQS
jgi:microcystin-dependent protein